jgi:DNA-binding NarL/FixJ family response regulator
MWNAFALASPVRCRSPQSSASSGILENGKQSRRDAGGTMDTQGVEGSPFTVALVGGRRLRERCLARYLELSGVRIAIGAVENLRESLLSQKARIDLVVIDTGDHTCSNPIIASLMGCLQETLPEAPIVVVSNREDRLAVLDALRHSARAYFPSSLDPEILLETLRFVQRGGTFVPLEVLSDASVHPQRKDPDSKRMETRSLTPSEQRVLGLLREGKPNKVIARELKIEETTVKVHVRRILKKLNAANRTQAALVAQHMADAGALA